MRGGRSLVCQDQGKDGGGGRSKIGKNNSQKYDKELNEKERKTRLQENQERIKWLVMGQKLGQKTARCRKTRED